MKPSFYVLYKLVWYPKVSEIVLWWAELSQKVFLPLHALWATSSLPSSVHTACLSSEVLKAYKGDAIAKPYMYSRFILFQKQLNDSKWQTLFRTSINFKTNKMSEQFKLLCLKTWNGLVVSSSNKERVDTECLRTWRITKMS